MNTLFLVFKSVLLSLAMSFAVLASGPVDINYADADLLVKGLNGIGPTKAEAIVAWREENGPFLSADQLVEVKGIGLATVEKNRDRIEVGMMPKSQEE